MREDGHDGERCRYCTLINAAVSVVGNGDLKDDVRGSANALLIAEFDRMREEDPPAEEDEGEDDTLSVNGQRPEPAEFR